MKRPAKRREKRLSLRAVIKAENRKFTRALDAHATEVISTESMAEAAIPEAPPKPLKIAILGSAPSSRMLAPFGDKEWTIWATSPANAGYLPRIDAWFEIHETPIMKAPEYAPNLKEYIEWLNVQPFDIYIVGSNELIPRGKTFPWRELVDIYTAYFFTSSVAWMMAAAIQAIEDQRAKYPELADHQEIRLYGVDMAADGEWADQRPGCHHFIVLCRMKGIKFDVPLESDIHRPPPLYGVTECSPFRRKLALHRREMASRLPMLREQARAAEREGYMIEGALKEGEYIERTWT